MSLNVSVWTLRGVGLMEREGRWVLGTLMGSRSPPFFLNLLCLRLGSWTCADCPSHFQACGEAELTHVSAVYWGTKGKLLVHNLQAAENLAPGS